MTDAGRHIALVTTTRADWGIMAPLAARLRETKGVRLSVIAGGAHLSAARGATADEITQAGFEIAHAVPMALDDDTPRALGHALGDACTGFADAFAALAPDIAVVLGDRFELLAVCGAALLARIPLAHLHGGEASEGQIDEQVRHAVSKMAHLHFPAADAYADRLMRMGEAPERIFTVGSLAVETIRTRPLPDWGPMARELGLDPARPVIAVTYHPVTLAADRGRAGALALVEALARFPDIQIVITGVNADPGADGAAETLHRLADTHPAAVLVPSLGHMRYLALVRAAAAVVGNSSSGIIEAPALGTPTVNIGPRQDGRLRAVSVIDCAPTPDAIAGALAQALSPQMQARAAHGETPYGRAGTAARIAEVLSTVPLEGLLTKPMHEAGAGRPTAMQAGRAASWA